ncbi:hypothetical protein ACDF64_10645 [Agromyces sp. MMS24-JH15]|uniref:hypothetical protein n=1 Tax=Agromyces sp. MMS24-JH15 TaxID=3243765 RepID=UPI003749F79A
MNNSSRTSDSTRSSRRSWRRRAQRRRKLFAGAATLTIGALLAFAIPTIAAAEEGGGTAPDAATTVEQPAPAPEPPAEVPPAPEPAPEAPAEEPAAEEPPAEAPPAEAPPAEAPPADAPPADAPPADAPPADAPDAGVDGDQVAAARVGAGGPFARAEAVAAAPPSSTPPPPEVDIEKSVASLEQEGDGWRIWYDVDVLNFGTEPIAYDLTDQLDFGPAVVIDSADYTKPGDVIPNAWTVGFDAVQTLATDRPLAAGTQEQWRVSAHVTIPADAYAALACPENGLLNKATVLVEGLPPKSAEACDYPQPPTITFAKSLASPAAQAPDGTWSISYLLEVENPSAVNGEYSLDDDLAFGDGIDLTGASYAVELNGAPLVTPWAGGGQIVADRPLAAGDTDEFVITVSGIVLEGPTLTVEQGICPPKGDTSPGAFNNVGMVTFGETKLTDTACDFPSAPQVSKTDGEAVQLEDGSWNVSYVLTAFNPGDGSKPAYYDLVDEPDFPAEVVLNSYSVEEISPNPGPIAVDLSPVPASIPIVNDRLIGPDEVHQYLITLNVDVPAEGIPSEGPPCLFNETLLTSGEIESRDDDCAPLGPEFDVGITKVYNLPEGETAIDAGTAFTYTLEVRNFSEGAVSDLTVTDAIDPQLAVDGTDADIIVDSTGTWQLTLVGNSITATSTGPYPGGDPVDGVFVASFTIPVVMLQPGPIQTPERVGPDDPIPPLPTVDMTDIPNEACVDMEGDTNPENNCDDVVVPTKKINPNAYVRCIADQPWLFYAIAVTPSTPVDGPITVTWVSADDGVHPVQTETRVLPAGQFVGGMLWPGATLGANGLPSGYPGYRPLGPGDDPNSPLVFNGPNGALILDESLPSFAWRNQTIPASITFQINPEQTVLAVYPQALPECALAGTGVAGLPTSGVETGRPAMLAGWLLGLGAILVLGAWRIRRRTEA